MCDTFRNPDQLANKINYCPLIYIVVQETTMPMKIKIKEVHLTQVGPSNRL